MDNGASNEDEIVEDGLNKENESGKGGGSTLTGGKLSKGLKAVAKGIRSSLSSEPCVVSLIVLVTMPHLESMMLKKDSGIA